MVCSSFASGAAAQGTDFITWGDESEQAVLISAGRVRVCPVPEGPYDVAEQQRACQEADQASGSKVSALNCGFYGEAVATDEQTEADFQNTGNSSFGDVGNLVVYKRDCSFIAAKNLPPCAFGVLTTAIESGAPLPSPTTVFATNICAPSIPNLIPFIPPIICIAGVCDSDPGTPP